MAKKQRSVSGFRKWNVEQVAVTALEQFLDLASANGWTVETILPGENEDDPNGWGKITHVIVVMHDG